MSKISRALDYSCLSGLAENFSLSIRASRAEEVVLIYEEHGERDERLECKAVRVLNLDVKVLETRSRA